MAYRNEFDPQEVARAQRGDTRLRDSLLTRLQPILKAFFIKRAGHRAEIDDLIQNTLVRVFNGLDDLENPARFKAFAMKAALFELQDLYRGRYSAKEFLYDPEEPPLVAGQKETGGLRIDLERALEELTPKARRILELKEAGYRYEEIAEMLETTEAAVKMQVKRAFEKLREMLIPVFLFVASTSVTLLTVVAT